MKLPSSLSSCILKTYTNGDSVISHARPSERLFSYYKLFIKLKPLQVQLIPITHCPLYVFPREKRATILFVESFKYRFPIVSLLRGEMLQFLQSFLARVFSRLLLTFSAPPLDPLKAVSIFLELVGTRTGDGNLGVA